MNKRLLAGVLGAIMLSGSAYATTQALTSPTSDHPRGHAAAGPPPGSEITAPPAQSATTAPATPKRSSSASPKAAPKTSASGTAKSKSAAAPHIKLGKPKIPSGSVARTQKPLHFSGTDRAVCTAAWADVDNGNVGQLIYSISQPVPGSTKAAAADLHKQAAAAKGAKVKSAIGSVADAVDALVKAKPGPDRSPAIGNVQATTGYMAQVCSGGK
jgi:hypothetical protein